MSVVDDADDVYICSACCSQHAKNIFIYNSRHSALAAPAIVVEFNPTAFLQIVDDKLLLELTPKKCFTERVTFEISTLLTGRGGGGGS